MIGLLFIFDDLIVMVMIKTLRKYDYLLPLLAFILFFLTQRNHFPFFLYAIMMVIMGLYFFPLKNLILEGNLQLKEKNIDFLGLFANFILATILASSVLFLYKNDIGSLDLSIKILVFINFAFLVYFYFKDDDNNRSLLHLCFTFFATALVV